MMNRLIPFLIMTVVCLCLWAASAVHQLLVKERARFCSIHSEQMENMSPLMAFTTVALGGFRGIIADMLWMRASELQNEGKFFELAQLADWITKLEPRFPTVWAFHAWNMAYNISVLFPDPEDRWRWVQQGIRLLRDEGLKTNPGSPELYWELGWLYQHKIGYVMDQAHWYYKLKLAEQMAALFDGPHPDYHAPVSDPGLMRLKDKYKLLPEVMEAVDRQYGPLDWRLPESHAIYWAFRGRHVATEGFIALKCDQMIFQCLSEAFRHGKLTFNPENGIFVTTPNLDIFPKAIKAYEEALSRYDDQRFHFAYANFLSEAVLILYTYNRIKQAKELFAILSKKYPGPETELGFDSFVTRCFTANIRGTSREDAMALVEGLMFQSYFWFALDDKERSIGFERLSQLAWQQYMNSRVSEDHRMRTGLPPLAVIRRLAFQRALDEIPQTNLTARLKAITPAEPKTNLTERAQ